MGIPMKLHSIQLYLRYFHVIILHLIVINTIKYPKTKHTVVGYYITSAMLHSSNQNEKSMNFEGQIRFPFM
jgi:hypothetical protein